PPSGVVAVTVGGTYDFFMKYLYHGILARLRRMGITRVSCKEEWIDHDEVTGEEYATVADRVAGAEGDTLLLLVHESHPPDLMSRAVPLFVDEVARRLRPGGRRLLIIVWLRENGEPLALTNRLPPVARFDPELVTNWFRDRLA